MKEIIACWPCYRFAAVGFAGTTDRVCLITGPAACVREAHDIIWEKIRSRVDTSKIGIEELQVTDVVVSEFD